MDCCTVPPTKPSPNPNPRNGKHVHHIGGIPVEFPYQPYGSQLAFMGRVISTLDRAQRDGHSHALLESPTGTGKSLSLLCSALAWQQNFRSKNLNANPSHSKPDPEAMSDPINHGGGFVPETQSSSMPESEILEPEPAPSVANTKTRTKKAIPTIFYASRTHSQITQLIREYRKTSYRVPMAILASRKHYCTNASVREKENLDEECKLLLKNGEVNCSEFKNVHKVKGHPSLQKGGCHEAHDIEDLVKVGQLVKGCSYYAACSMAGDAQLVFCPYSYIVNPIVRGAVDVDIEGAIVILDEAHNIEEMASDSGSVDIEEDILHELQIELGQLCLDNALVYQPLLDLTEGIISWMQQRKSTLEKREFQDYFSCWTGDKALKELQEANISQQCFPIWQECATKAIKIATDMESDVPRLSGLSVITLEGLFSSLSYFFSGNGIHIYDYQLALHHYVKKDYGNGSGGWVYTFGLWCLNPAVVFKGIADLSLSVILTSGTLSPMNSFSSELGVQFRTCLEAPHVIDTESQLWASVISSGPGNHPLNASYKKADGYAFQDALGASLEEIFKVVPGGSLVFFPSYKLMEKLCGRWRETSQWSRLNAKKPLFVEPRGGSPNDFESVLKRYYNCVRRGNKPAPGRKRKEKKVNPNCLDAMVTKEHSKDGAAFLAVCRGKVSEGIDFSDDNARTVIIVGIPFPNINDIQVAQKKKYNDTYKSSKGLLSGNEWYCYQAFRALNQAAGRCIRHRFDYGAIIFLDQRFQEERNTAYISKWLKKSIRQYDSFDLSLQGLKSFFKNIKEDVGKQTAGVVQISDDNEEIIASVGWNKGLKRKKNQNSRKADHNEAVSMRAIEIEKYARFGHSFSSNMRCDANFPQMYSQRSDESHPHVLIDEEDDTCRESFAQETDFEKDLRYCKDTSKVCLGEKAEKSIVKEIPVAHCSVNIGSPQFSKGDCYSPSINQASTEFPDQLVCSMSLTSSSGPHSKVMHELTVTPEKECAASTIPEAESPLNLSVNSHYQKRRNFMGSTFVNLIQEPDNAPDAKTGHVAHIQSPATSIVAKCRTDIGAQHKSEKSNVSQQFLENNNGVPYVSSGLTMDERLQIFCSLCRNPLGLPEDNLYVTCSLTSSSKVHLAYLLKGVKTPNANTATSIPVLISDISSVNKRLWNRTPEVAQGQGIWSEEDGCVFGTLHCPFCTSPNNCIGVQIRATDASNVQLLNKIMFYVERLHMNTPESSKDEDLSTTCCSDLSEVAVAYPVEKFSFSQQCQNSGGWRTTKSKLRLPKRGLQSVSEDKCGAGRT